MKKNIIFEEAIAFHTKGRPGKFEIAPSKSLATQKELSLAYSPGVAAPCLEIEKDPSKSYDMTARGNIVGVISNGTAVLGLGNIGALASKPVMEGKAVLFKRFADIDGIDLEVDTQDVDEFINAVKHLSPSFGGINLEDIKAPECFVIEDRLKEIMDIPVFHDDQHGTAIAVVAGLINALDVTKKKIEDVKIVSLGAGAASIACANLIIKYGAKPENMLMLDREGVIHKGRTSAMNPWKEKFAVETTARTLEDAITDADIFIGLSGPNALSVENLKKMAPSPIIFAMANPDPEIVPELVYEHRPDAIIATGRSDYPNQVNNALCFPYIFRGALDVRATHINDEMKLAAAHGIAKLARSDVPEEADRAYGGHKLQYGKNYIIPVPFDPRLIQVVPPLVAKAAMETGVARKPIDGMDAYRNELMGRLDPTLSNLEIIFEKVRANPKQVVFAEGEEETAIRAALSFQNQGLGHAILVGREAVIRGKIEALGIPCPDDLQILNAKLHDNNKRFIDYLYQKLQRKGFLYRDCQRLVHQDRHVFSACLTAFGKADAMITGLTRNYSDTLADIMTVIPTQAESQVFGMSIVNVKGRSLLIADTAVHDTPDATTLAAIDKSCAASARAFGHDPRIAFLSYSNFGNPMSPEMQHVAEAVALLDQEKVDFEYEGDVSVQVALNMEMRQHYPFCRLSGPANVLIMPDLHSATIASQLLTEGAGGTMIGPILSGLSYSAQIVSMASSISDMTKMAAIAAYQSRFNAPVLENA